MKESESQTVLRVTHGKMTSVKQTAGAKMESPSKKNIVEIYTDWANHYLEKTKVTINGSDKLK